MITFDQLQLALKIQRTWRATIHEIIPAYKLADHSVRSYALYKYFGGTDDEAMVLHDLEEVLTGDIPSPQKKLLQGLDHFEAMRPQFSSPEQKRLGKLADKLCLVLQIKPYINFCPDILNIYQEELECAMDIAKELGKTREVKKILKEAGR